MQISKVDDQIYLAKQYRDASKLNARIQLHQQFSINKYGWHRWVFDQFGLPPICRILELGCGSGFLWLENLDRLPSDWKILLSDFSAGMLKEAKRKLEKYHQFQFNVVNAQFIPFGSQYFDAIIANHMLYHVPDKPAAFSEIRRVLKPSGHFYASTIGERHLSEMADLLGKFDIELASWRNLADSFTLENGTAQLSQWFAKINRYLYEDALEVTEVSPLVDYIISGRVNIPGEQLDQFKEFVTREMKSRGGTLHITKDSGLFVSIREGE